MGDIVNLRTRRKRVERERSASRAAQRRIDFGLSKASRGEASVVVDAASRRLEAHRLAPPQNDGA